MSTRVLVLGGTGMLGHKIWQVLSDRFDTHVGARAPHAEYQCLGLFDADRWHGGVDAMEITGLLRVMREVRPDVIVNCMGVIKQRAEAKDPLVAVQTNALYPHLLFEVARTIGAHLIHISTDCVFSGVRGNYLEEDNPDPPDLYGRSKLLGEIDAPGCLTLRTSIIGRELRSSLGLVEWFLAQDGGRVRGFAGAIYTGLPTLVLASILADIITRGAIPSGLYHLGSDPISKYDLLLLLLEAYGLTVDIERDDSLRCDRSLDSTRFRAAEGLEIPSWPKLVATMANDSTPYGPWRGHRSWT
jgi:dTDP-4-dehydrorhamnose reductase